MARNRPPRDAGDFSDLDSAERWALRITGFLVALVVFFLWWCCGESIVDGLSDLTEW